MIAGPSTPLNEGERQRDDFVDAGRAAPLVVTVETVLLSQIASTIGSGTSVRHADERATNHRSARSSRAVGRFGPEHAGCAGDAARPPIGSIR